jgi:ubiquinone/menaquinone biosynthesis C-methylase UbiE
MDAAEQARRTVLREAFDVVAEGYDGRALRFFPAVAGALVGLLDLRGGERVLDVACGTGHASLALSALLPRGEVTAVDFSAGMLGVARDKASAAGARNIRFLRQDMHDLDLPPASFDAVVCSFGLFFAQDMETQLRRLVSLLRPGGRIAVSSFREDYFQPLRGLLMERLATCGVPPPPPAWKRVATEEGCRELFLAAGLGEVTVRFREEGYDLGGAGQWWEIVWNAGFRRLVGQLLPADRERFREEHLREVGALAAPTGIPLGVGVLLTTGRRPPGPSGAAARGDG